MKIANIDDRDEYNMIKERLAKLREEDKKKIEVQKKKQKAKKPRK